MEQITPERHPSIANTVVGPWHGVPGKIYPNYQCTLCQFCTLDEQTMREHQFHEDHHWPWPDGENPYLNEGGIE